ncbi:unnamed protein product [Calypogeia fissa]
MSPSPPFPSPLLPPSSPHSASPTAPHPGVIGEHRASSSSINLPQHLQTQPQPQQQQQQQQIGDPPNGEFLLHLLQAGSQVQHQHQQQQQQGSNIGNGGAGAGIGAGGGGLGGGGYEQPGQKPHYSFAMPGIVSGGGDIPMAAWDPAVAALGPSHSYPQQHNGMVGGSVGGGALVGGGGGGGDGGMRDFPPPPPPPPPGLYPSSGHAHAQFHHNVSMGGSGWPPPPPHHHHHQQPPQQSPHLQQQQQHQQQQQQQHPFASQHPFPPTSSISSSFSSPGVDLRLLQQGGRGGGHSLVPIPGVQGVHLSPTLYGSHVEMLQRRSAEWHHHHQLAFNPAAAATAAIHHQHQQQQQQLQLRSMLGEGDIPPSNNSPAPRGASVAAAAAERGGAAPHQQFYGDGAELMKLLQISSSTNKASASSAAGVGVGVGLGGGGGGADTKAVVDKQQAGVGSSSNSSGGGVAVQQKPISPAIVHGPIGPPKRNENTTTRSSSSPAEDLLGRFWPAPPSPSFTNGSSKDHENSTKPPGFMAKDIGQANSVGLKDLQQQRAGWWGEQQQHVGGTEKKFELPVGVGGESLLNPPFANRDVGHRFGLSSRGLYPLNNKGVGLPENLEYPEGRGLLGGWAGDFLDEAGGIPGGGGGAQQQYRKNSSSTGGLGGRPREDQLYGKVVEQQQTVNFNSNNHNEQQQLLLQGEGPSSKEFEMEYSRESNGRVGEGNRGGLGGRRGPPPRGAIGGGRRGGRIVTGQWVAVNERQREREGSLDISGGGPSGDIIGGGGESGSDKGSNSAGNSFKEESMSFAKEGGGSQKMRDELKRRRGGQQQEWRMKSQPSHPSQIQTQVQHQGPGPKMVDFFSAGLDSSVLINGNYQVSSPMKIRPLASQVDHPGLPSNVVQESSGVPGSAIEESKQIYHDRAGYLANGRSEGIEDGFGKDDEEELAEAFAGYLDPMDEREIGHRQGFNQTSPVQEEVEFEARQENMRETRRHPHRTIPAPSLKPEMRYRPDLEKFTGQMLSLYTSLIPTNEEENRRRQFLSHLDQLVARDWPGAMLFLFGSCANAFGVCNSDIDVCLSINDDQLSKADLVLKMAAILRSDNMQNVQALTHARVPIVKFTDPTTGISCDICVNNMLAVVNSKLLHDYSRIDVRLRQLAFLVKHWAKRRQVNETYRGTLSSYAYVLMCIHFLQQRKPAILPCLQEMRPTYRVTVGNIDCAYYDQVETLQNFGSGNMETLGELLTSFFEYWAFRHDYNRAVISVRTGGYLSKDEKEWTRRIGNERHLICIEDPLETVHDLGRVVDRHSIRVLRDEFHRAAKILRHDLNPCITLFEPFIREKP